MSETTLLRQNAIRNNASVGATTPGPIKTGELPHVQIKAVPSAPQLQASQQQKTVQILAPNSKGAITSGDLPMVQIKMGQNGPQPDNGQESAVVVRENKQPTLAAGGLPMVQVKHDGGPPKIQTMPNVANGPPRIPTAAPALSAPRTVQTGVTRVAAPVPAPVPAPVVAAVPLPELPTFSTDELMLFQHVLTIYVANLSSTTEVSAEGAESGEPRPESEAVQFARAVLAKTDDALVAIAIHVEAAANSAAIAETTPVEAPPAAPRASGYVTPRAGTGGYYSPAAVAPQAQQSYQVPQHMPRQVLPQQAPAPAAAAPRAGGYVMQQASVRRTQLNSGLVPRGVPRAKGADGKLPMAIIQMNGQKAVVQNQAEIDAARAALAAQAAAAEAPVAPVADDPSQG